MTESQNMEKITAIGVLAENCGEHMKPEMSAVSVDRHSLQPYKKGKPNNCC